MEEQLRKFVQEHPDTRLIIIDTLQKVREVCGEKYSYANDYAALTTSEKPVWSGSATELAIAIQSELKPNTLSMRLNVRAGKLLEAYQIHYENRRTHAGRTILLSREPPHA